jgi:drug/metabolite transporter (DMT)-like permease
MLYVGLLAILGTALAKIIFNRLIQLSDPVFSTSVTYLIPIVALFWGILDGESFSLWQLLAGGIILLGVYLSNLKTKTKQRK